MEGGWKRGDRVELVSCSDEITKLKPGDRGTVSCTDDAGTVFVNWDSGSRLGMIADAGDIIRKVTEPA